MDTERLKELKFTSWCIKNRTSIFIFTLIISIWGLITYNNLPKELFPDVVVPTISVATIYPGATPKDVENLITKPLEKQIKSINGVKKVSSNSISDVSIMTVEFNTNLVPAECKRKVSDAVDKAKKDLPTDLKNDPQVQEFDISEVPIMNINIAGDLPLDRIKKHAEDLKDRIESMKEITRVDIVGGLEREIQVNVDLYKMTSAGLSLRDIEEAIQRQNLNVAGGELRVGELKRNVRVTGEFLDPKELNNMVIRSFMGNQVFLRDIAEIKDDFKDRNDFARLDHKTVVTLNVIKRGGENLIDAADQINKIIDEEKKTNFPPGLDVRVTGDTSQNTRIQLHDLLNTVVLGFIFVVFVLMYFMGFTNAFFVGLAVPLSCLIAFILMPFLGMTMNVIVLFSLLLALGIIVDDAIVVIENTHRIFHKYSFNIFDSAKYAAGEVFVPVLAGTATTLAPFVPLLFWPGIVGKFMSNLPITLIITLGASLFVAFVMNPVFAVTFMKKDDATRKSALKDYWPGFVFFALAAIIAYALKSIAMGNLCVFMIALILMYHFVFTKLIKLFQEKAWPNFLDFYRKILNAAIIGFRPLIILLSTVVLLVVSILVFLGSKPVIEFFPTAEPNFAYIYCKMPMGTDATVTDSVTKIIETRVFKVIGEHNPLVTSVISNVGLGAGDPQNPDKVATPHKSKVTIAFTRFAERNGKSTLEVLNKLREEFKSGIPGAELSVEQERNGPPVGKPINIEISGDDFTKLDELSKVIKAKVDQSGIAGIDQLRSDLQISKPEIILELDREKMQREGISLGQVGGELRTALFGKDVSKFRDADKDADITVRLQEKYRNNIDDLLNLNISFMDMSVGSFRQVPLSAIAKVTYSTSISTINRKNQRRIVNLSSDVVSGFNANDVTGQIQKQVLDNLDLPVGYEAKITGEQEQQKETADFLSVAFGGALALMFLILVTQFNSVTKPLIIFSTVLFSLIGIFLGFTIFHMKFSVVMTGVGIFSLAGIVVRNGILMIEFIDELRERGLTLREAVVEGGATRLTPVVLTAMSAILGLIPLAVGLNIDFETLFRNGNPHIFFGGDNVAFWGPLAWTMIFGLTFATFLTLIVVPMMVLMVENLIDGTKRWMGGSDQKSELHFQEDNFLQKK
jgi:multidrug efflux pump subunit AcrB